MKRITMLVAAATLVCSFAASKPAQGTKEIDPKVVEAWKKVGADFGWLGPNESGYWQFSEVKPKDPAALPAFRIFSTWHLLWISAGPGQRTRY